MVKQTKGGGRLARRLGENIAARRRARKWTQEEFAERLGVASETVSRFERGATLPSLLTLHRVGQVLKAPMAQLLAESSPVPDDQAGVIATWITELRDDDREYVLDLVKRSCDHLSGRK